MVKALDMVQLGGLGGRILLTLIPVVLAARIAGAGALTRSGGRRG